MLLAQRVGRRVLLSARIDLRCPPPPMVLRGMTTDASEKLVRVWWDSQCPLCTKEISLMKSLDSRRAIDFVDLHNPHENPIGTCPLRIEDALARFHAQDVATTKVVSGAAAFALMWTVLPRPFRWVGAHAQKNPAFLAFLEDAYVLFLTRYRPSFQRIARRLS
ncbi:Aste57867_16105 [Aphanomyces stellatus]|uniref:Aste57867_16105 protein n=1 Tax=Aphanomyces stellatus TaxID=120398 RepID=A0A485L617_9STRA|nr:hypothetical protein As57867_016049 [Aphanomyces stellatus]VFT92888.1 Aste57867_16105 [Aphanomyces stellatus]